MNNNHKEIFLKEYKTPQFTITTVDLKFDIFNDYTVVTNKILIKRLDKEAKHLRLDGQKLELLSLTCNGKKISHEKIVIDEDFLTIDDVQDDFILEIVTKIYPDKNKELEGLYKSGGIFCTQNEPEGFRKITYFLDRPDVMAKYTTKIIADNKYPILLSNGNKKQSGMVSDTRHFCIWEDPFAKPSYLFALVVGDLGNIQDKFITISDKEIELNIYCDKGNEDRCFHAMTSLKKAMKWDEKQYKREYDLDIYNIVAVDSFNMGAMENKGLNIFNSHYVLASKESATDADYMGIQSVIAHEYFHNWTGNRITCRSWFELTLKEGLTVYRDQCFSADMNSKDVVRIENVKRLKEHQFIEDSGPTAHPIQPNSYISINNFYTPTVYEKGAEVIGMYHTLLGEENYKKSMQLYFDTFDGQAVGIDDFFWAMEQNYNGDLTQFKRWYHQSGTPTLEVRDEYKDNTLTLTCKQIIPNAPDAKQQYPLMYPLRIALFYDNAKLILDKSILIKKELEKFTFKNITCKPKISLNRNFSAPIKIIYKNQDYSFLMRYDTDTFNRYEMAQEYALKSLNTLIDCEQIDENYINSFKELLDADIDLMTKAKLLELPTVSNLLQTCKIVDFEKLCNAQDILKLELATIYKESFLDIYNRYHDLKDNGLTPQAMGKRAIKNMALQYLACLQSDDIYGLCKNQYNLATTMQDRITALSCLTTYYIQDAKWALDDFYKCYHTNTLIMNKYFSIIALSRGDGVLNHIIKAQHDKAYDKNVPNLVRALIGSFIKNYRYFHAKDGSGYRFLAQQIIEIDKSNPQISSALVGAFKIYKKLDEKNKELMCKELQKIKNIKDLSNNCYEIILKILT